VEEEPIEQVDKESAEAHRQLSEAQQLLHERQLALNQRALASADRWKQTLPHPADQNSRCAKLQKAVGDLISEQREYVKTRNTALRTLSDARSMAAKYKRISKKRNYTLAIMLRDRYRSELTETVLTRKALIDDTENAVQELEDFVAANVDAE
jgi:hypothetical protein